ncbi:MAG: hypothetical protein R3362_12630, partial [Rhodothermales bacterium]|nr:hypothetical protein [Rhodothermales bacterium]
LGAAPLERPAHLRGHDVASVPLFQNVVRSLGVEPGAVVNVQANSPSCGLRIIEKAVRVMEYTDCDELLTVYPHDRSNNGSVWSFSYGRLMDYGDPRTHAPDVLLTDASTDVHTRADFERALREFEEPLFLRG